MWPLAAQHTAQALLAFLNIANGLPWYLLVGASSDWENFPHHLGDFRIDIPHHCWGKHWHMSSSFPVEGETRPACELRVFSETSGAQEPQAVICDYSSCFALHTDEATNLSWDHNAELLLPPQQQLLLHHQSQFHQFSDLPQTVTVSIIHRFSHSVVIFIATQTSVLPLDCLQLLKQTDASALALDQ